MDNAITFTQLLQVGAIIVAIWAAIKAIREFFAWFATRHDREKKWDEAEVELEETKKIMLENVQAEREKIYQKYDTILADMEDKIDTNHKDTEAKLTQVKEELRILTDCMAAVLDGLHQQGCNGRVTEASNNLQAYMNMRMHE